MNFLILFMAALMATSVRSDEQPLEPNEKQDTQKSSASVEESAKELKSKDGDTLESLPSNVNSQSQYNSVDLYAKQSPVQLDIGPYSGQQYSGQPQHSQVSHQQPITVYRPVDITNDRYGADAPADQQQSYVTQEQPVYAQKTYIRQPQVEDSGEDSYSKRQSESGSYQLQPETPSSYASPPISSPGISSTYTSPDVKIVSHTRTFMPIVYKKPPQENTQTTEQEYDKAVQGSPGGSYAQEQGQSYDSDPQSPVYSKASAGYLPHSQSEGYYSGGYRQPVQEEQQQEVVQQQQEGVQQQYQQQSYSNGAQEGSRAGYLPVQAHVQVIEEPQKDGYSSPQQSYGSRTHPRPQYKNYKPSGYTPTALLAPPNAFSPPSPPLSTLMPPPGPQSYSDSKQDDSYNSQQYQQQQEPPQQRPNDYKQTTYGVGVEQSYEPQSGGQSYGQSNAQTVGYGRERTPSDYSYNSDDKDADDQQSSVESYGRGEEKPSYSSSEEVSNSNENTYNSGEIGGQKPINSERFRQQDFSNHLNTLGPKYNGERGPVYQSGRELNKPQDIEYGFIPLTEENIKQMVGYGPEGYGQNRGPGNYGNNRGKQEEGYGEGGLRGGYGAGDGGYGGNGGNGGNGGGLRRPNFGPNGGEYEGENVGLMYGGSNGGEGPRGGGYGNDEFRGPPVGGPPKRPMGISGYRKPAFERPSFEKGGEASAQYLKDYGNTANDEEEDEELDNEDSDYVGAAYKGRGRGGLPPGASYNPRDVGLDESLVAQLNLPTPVMSPAVGPGIAPGMNPRYRGPYGGHRPTLDIPFSGSVPFPSYNGLGPGMAMRPRPRPRPYSASGMGFRSQYGYRAAASEVSPAQAAPNTSSSPVLSNLLNLNPIKNLRSLMSYITGGING